MKLRRYLPAAAAAVLAFTTVMPTASASDISSSEVSGGSSEILPLDTSVLEESQRLRVELGFAAETAELRQLVTELDLDHASVGGQLPINEWGFIGTKAENAEVQRRESLLLAVEPHLTEFANRSNYAGHFLDNSNGGRLVVQFSGSLADATDRRAVAAEALDAGSSSSDVMFRVVDRSSDELTSAMKSLWAKKTATSSELVAIAEDVKSNSLIVTVEPGTDQAHIDALAKSSTVPITVVEGEGQEEACTSRNACNSPQRGGVGIQVGTGLCSAGWVVNLGSARGVITAGHCWYGTNSGTVSSSGTYGSLTSTNALYGGSHADMRYISVSDSRPWLYQSSSVPARTVTGSSLGSVGSTSCLFGRNSASARCGTISSTNASHYSGTCGCTIYVQSVASYSSAGGDSGGAVASSSTGNIARGVHSGTFGGGKHYSWIGYSSTYNMGTLATG